MSLSSARVPLAARMVVLALVVGVLAWGALLQDDSTRGATAGAATAPDPYALARASCVGSRKDPGGPDPWGGCWPGPHNTGVPTNVRLTSVSGDRTAARDGEVIDGLDVDGCILVGGLGVTITNTRARCVTLLSNSRARYCHPEESQADRQQTECTVVSGLSDARPRAGQPRLTIRNSTIDCDGTPGNTGTGIGDRNIKVVRVEVLDCENGLDADAFVTVKHSLIHDLYNSAVGDPHTDGLQSALGHRLRLVHNVIYAFTSGCSYPQTTGACNGTSSIGLGVRAKDTVLSRNLLAGGAYTVYCPRTGADGLLIVENRFSEAYSPRVGEFGAMTGCGGSGITRKGNKRIHF